MTALDDAGPPGSTILVLGGARSGKSRYAQRLAEASGRDPVFIATAEALDTEMGNRIARHREDRGPRWRTIEAPLDMTAALANAASPETVILVDCLTLWLTNVVLAGLDTVVEIEALAASISRLPGPAVFVSNEVGMGIVPETPLGRSFRDDQGRLNQAVAAACETVFFIAAGLPILLKPRAEPELPPWARTRPA